MNLTLTEILTRVNGTLLSGASDAVVHGFAALQEAVAGDLSLFSNNRYRAQLLKTRASIVLVPNTCTDFPEGVSCVGVAEPSRAFDVLVDVFGIQPEPFCAHIHPTAVISESAIFNREAVAIGAYAVISDDVQIADGAEIGALCYLGKGAKVGAGSRFFAKVVLHDRCVVGERVILHSGVVIGADGFGYEFENGRHRKVRQLGTVEIGNDVEIGAGSMVDRGRIGRTKIGEGTKIDNLVQVGHNTVIGKHCILVSGVAIAGSVVVGDYVVMAAQVGIAGHVTIGSQSTLGGRAGVTKDVAPGTSMLGFPAVPAREERRRIGAVARLPQLLARVQKLEGRLAEMEAAARVSGD
ncbi:MAG: UDP-3-O-(3-hydroxymyristoyl)glucosamine N-acyltransferase [Verrucomicrobiota bacterium]